MLVTGVLSVVLAQLAVLLAVLVVAAHREGAGGASMEKTFEELRREWLGLVVLTLPAQATFLAAALLGALRSPRPLAGRLGLCKGTYPAWTWLLFVAATPAVHIIPTLIRGFLLPGPSEQLEDMQELINSAEGLQGLVLLVFSIALVPGAVEELLFRGFVQGGLLGRWHPAVAIVVSSLLFGAAHLDLHQSVNAGVLGLWLGILAWRSGSLVPSMLCHAANNLIALSLMRVQDPADFEGVTLAALILVSLFLFVSVAALILSVLLLAQGPGPLQGRSLADIGRGILRRS